MSISASGIQADRTVDQTTVRVLRGITAVLMLSTALYILTMSLATRVGLQSYRTWIGNAILLSAKALASIIAALVVKYGQPVSVRRSWRFFLVASLLTLCASLWNVTQRWAILPAIFPSYMDEVLRSLAYPLYFFGLLFYPPAPERGLPWVRVTLDIVFVLLSVGLGIGYALLVPSAAPSEALLLWAYPLGDVWLLAVLLSVLSRPGEPRARLSAAALSTAFGVMTVADIYHAHLVQSGVQGLPAWLEGAWFLSHCCRAWAGLYTLPGRRAQAAPEASPQDVEVTVNRVNILLRVAIGTAVAAVILDEVGRLSASAGGRLFSAGLLFLIGLLLLRYFLLRMANEQLTRELQAAAAELQKRVEERTRELAERVAEVQRLRAEAERRADEQAALLRVSALVGSSLRLDEVLNTVVRQAAELFHADRVGLYVYDENQAALIAKAQYAPSLSEEEQSRWACIPLSTSPAAAEVVRTSSPLLIPDIQQDPRMPRSLSELGILSSLLLPMPLKHKLLGVIILDAREAQHFTPHDVELAQAMAQHAASAMEKARLYEELGASMEQLKRTQADLMRAQRLQALGQMVAGAAHELNNPLTVAHGYAELLLRENLPPQVHEDTLCILEATERCQRVVASLLAFGQREAAQRRPIDINQVVEDTLAPYEFELETSQIRVERRLASALPPVNADAALMRQVFFNIILNAKQAMSEAHGSGRLTVRTCHEGNVVRVEISDDGPGIPAEIMDRIFDPFFTTRPQGQGMGLGLSMCYGIVSEHGGRIWALSPALQQYADARGPGATLVVELPAKNG